MTDSKRREIIKQTDGISIIQCDNEIFWALGVCREHLGREATHFLELGCHTGGSLCMWEQLLSYEGRLYGVSPSSNPQRLIDNVLLVTGRTVNFVNGLSEDPEVIEQLLDMLDGDKFDGIFCDTIHSEEQTSKEYNLYRPLIKSPGVMVFHDIVTKDFFTLQYPDSAGGKPNTGDFWARIKYHHDYVEKHDKDSGVNFGIGILLL